jgi:hypothetical protein
VRDLRAANLVKSEGIVLLGFAFQLIIICLKQFTQEKAISFKQRADRCLLGRGLQFVKVCHRHAVDDAIDVIAFHTGSQGGF